MVWRSAHRHRYVTAVVGACLWLVGASGSQQLLAADAEEVPLMAAGEDKVLYLPITGDSPSIQSIRQKEVTGIERFMRSRKLTPVPILTRIDAPEIYLQVEPQLVVEARDAACANVPEGAPAILLSQGQELLKSGNVEEARKFLLDARTQLPCAQSKLSRTQIAELLLWTGLAHPVPVGEEAQGYLRAGLAADPLIIESPKLPANATATLQKIAADLEHTIKPVDLHVPQGEGDMWTHKSLLLDGRRVVFDKLFLQVTPGTHYVQITLPDERSWGAFLEVKPDSSPDLADLARQYLGLKTRYRQQFERILTEGVAGPGFLQGLRLYTARLKRDQIYLTAITQETDGTWITVRRFHMARGIEVPPLNRIPTENAVTASVPLVLSQPWAVDVGLSFSQMLGMGRPDYSSAGAGLEVDAFYLISPRLRLGALAGLGGRGYTFQGDASNIVQKVDIDVTLGLMFGLSVPLGAHVNFAPDLGYEAHLNQLRAIPIYCDNALQSDKSYACGFDKGASDETMVFNLRGLATGAHVRLGLEFGPLGKGALSVRGVVRAGYSPQMISLAEQIPILVTTQELNGTKHDDNVTLSIDPDSRFFLLHQIDVFLGINGTY